MAGVNCTAFRLLCKQYGAELIYTQMYPVNVIIEKSNELDEYLNILKEEKPIGIQLIGNVKDPWSKAIKLVEKDADTIDINFHCTEDYILENKAGAYLLQHLDQIEKIVKICKKATKKPITAKIRSGWDSNNAVNIAKVLEKSGVDTIIIHPRTAKQKYGGKADWNIIKQVKQVVKIPVIGNGDITMPGHAKAMIEQTKCDAVMIGREARRNSKIFEEVNYLLKHGKNMESVPKDPKQLIREFIALYRKHEKRESLNEIKDHCRWFMSGCSISLRERIRDAKDVDQILSLIQ